MRLRPLLAILLCFVSLSAAAQGAAPFDVLIKGGTVYDGSGGAPFVADVGIRGDRVAAVGLLAAGPSTRTIDARGMAVAPGFINMLSWATESLLVDPRSMSDLKQGVTTEIFGEGSSMGPLNARMRAQMLAGQHDIKFDVPWTSLSDYLQYLEKRGVTPNVASFIGAATVREYVIGEEDKAPTPAQLEQMRELVRAEMKAGALGIGSSLIYAPGFYAKTDELIALAKVAAEYRGKYISHMRSEGARLLESLDELIAIAREAHIPAEVYHLKASGQDNWPKMAEALKKIEAARARGLTITANMYTYPAAATGLDASIPPSALDGGYAALFARLRDPAARAKILAEMRTPTSAWENLYRAAGSPDKVLLTGFKSDKLKPLTALTLAQVAARRGTDPENTILDLMLEDQSRVGTIYFLMSEDNIRKQIAYPWMSFGSDAQSAAPEGVFLKSSTHPRTYGNVARLLGKYVREEKIISLQEAVRRLSALPAANLGLAQRGVLAPGYFADVVIFDPATIIDTATFAKPQQYAVGVRDVLINGVQVLSNGEHTGKLSGRALYGPGRTADGK